MISSLERRFFLFLFWRIDTLQRGVLILELGHIYMIF